MSARHALKILNELSELEELIRRYEKALKILDSDFDSHDLLKGCYYKKVFSHEKNKLICSKT